MPKINRESVLSLALGFVVLWFGYNEIIHPSLWAVYLPPFLAQNSMANSLVVAHGAVLVLAGLSLIFNFHRRKGAFIIFLMLLGIVATLLLQGGLNEIAVRDIGLMGMALALWLKS